MKKIITIINSAEIHDCLGHTIKGRHSRGSNRESILLKNVDTRLRGYDGRHKLFIIFILPLLLLLWTALSSAAIPVEVTMGRESILTLKYPAERISIASPEIADLKLISPTEIVINGKKQGVTGVIIWDEQGKKFYDIIVADYSNERRKEELLLQIKELAPDSDVKIVFVGDTIVLSGKLKNEITRKKIEILALNYSAKVTNLLVIGEAQQVI